MTSYNERLRMANMLRADGPQDHQQVANPPAAEDPWEMLEAHAPEEQQHAEPVAHPPAEVMLETHAPHEQHTEPVADYSGENYEVVEAEFPEWGLVRSLGPASPPRLCPPALYACTCHKQTKHKTKTKKCVYIHYI